MALASGRRPRASAEHPERDLVAAIRAELAAVEPARACCREAERAGLHGSARGGASSPAVARLAVRLERVGRNASDRRFDWSTAAEHCRFAYLRGLFLARGSLSLGGGRTHLEFVVPAADAPALVRQLEDVGLPASLRFRRGAGVVTWKSAETVVGFLRRAGASASVLEFEARLVGRALRGQLNRAVNAEESNLRRQVGAAARQLAAIDSLEGEGRLERLPDLDRAVARARREAPDATLGELSNRLGVSRSLVQRTLQRLESLALHSDERSDARG